jgi:hypothetical protein
MIRRFWAWFRSDELTGELLLRKARALREADPTVIVAVTAVVLTMTLAIISAVLAETGGETTGAEAVIITVAAALALVALCLTTWWANRGLR